MINQHPNHECKKCGKYHTSWTLQNGYKEDKIEYFGVKHIIITLCLYSGIVGSAIMFMVFLK